MKPLVSVCILAYRHEAFIAQALDSVLGQQTDFPFEIVLGEDDSPDNTRSICQQYASQYPDKIRLLLNNRDTVIYIDGRPTGRWNLINSIQQAQGKYVAILDGDDFWTDTRKLQKQVDLLEARPELSLTFTDIMLVDEHGKDLGIDKLPEEMKRELDRQTLIGGYYPCPPMGTILFRKAYFNPLPAWFTSLKNGDIALTVHLAARGNADYVPGKMTAYRQHGGGIWSARNKVYKARNTISMRKDLLRLFAPIGAAHNSWLINNNYLYLLKAAATKVRPGAFLKAAWEFGGFLLRHPRSIPLLLRRLRGGEAPKPPN